MNMMVHVPQNVKTFASTRGTSYAVAPAIFEMATEGDEARMWAEPTAVERAAVIKRAWELADPGDGYLFWGVKVCSRDSSR
jgi:hypothetical protein